MLQFYLSNYILMLSCHDLKTSTATLVDLRMYVGIGT